MSGMGGYSPATISAIRLQKLREILVEEPTVAEQELRAAGWRRCAESQGETQHCGMLDAAVRAERDAICQLADDMLRGVDAIPLIETIRARGKNV